jgi:hypothetical protein
MVTEFGSIGPIQFPRSYTKGRKFGQPTVVFIHTTEGSEGRLSAENGVAYDQRRSDGTSTHFFVDQDSIAQCVPTYDEAHTARAHGNDVGIHIEVCGRAGQTAAQWSDAASDGAVRNAARVGYLLRKRDGASSYPLVNLTPGQLRAGARGFAEHYDATRAWPDDKGTHTDPGPNFPWARMFDYIRGMEKVDVREYEMEKLDDLALPILKRGDDDNVRDGWDSVRRAQRCLAVKVDGIYGKEVTSAVKALGFGNGETIDLPVWRKLFGISKV